MGSKQPGRLLNTVTIYVFQKMLHGFIGLTNVILKRKLCLAGQAVHVHFVTGAGYMQGRAAGGAY